MREYTGWLFDLYAHPKQGIVLWIVGEDGKPHSFTQLFQITFYVGGPFHRLRQLWKFLQTKPVRLYRTQRRDLHEGVKDLLLTLAVPTIVMVAARARPDLFRAGARPRRR